MRPLPVVDADRLYQLMLNRADRVQGRLQQLALGLSWSLAELRVDADPVARGLCFSPRGASRDLPWPGTLTGCLSWELTPWLLRWEPAAAVVGATVVNALINHQSALPARAQPLACEWAPQLAVFEHFAPPTCRCQCCDRGPLPRPGPVPVPVFLSMSGATARPR